MAAVHQHQVQSHTNIGMSRFSQEAPSPAANVVHPIPLSVLPEVSYACVKIISHISVKVSTYTFIHAMYIHVASPEIECCSRDVSFCEILYFSPSLPLPLPLPLPLLLLLPLSLSLSSLISWLTLKSLLL